MWFDIAQYYESGNLNFTKEESDAAFEKYVPYKYYHEPDFDNCMERFATSVVAGFNDDRLEALRFHPIEKSETHGKAVVQVIWEKRLVKITVEAVPDWQPSSEGYKHYVGFVEKDDDGDGFVEKDDDGSTEDCCC